MHAWALKYIGGVRDEPLTWEQIEAGAKHTSRQRSTALGRAVHAVYEAYHRRETVDWRGLPGEIALSGVHLIPHPDECLATWVEAPLGHEPVGDADGGVALRVHGVLWRGYRDLTAQLTCAGRRRLSTIGDTLLVDYKTSASITRYALTPDELRVDVQCNLYALDTCLEYDLDAVQARWLYVESKRVRRAEARDVIVARDDAFEIMRPVADFARELDAIPSVEAAPKNHLACGDYGGCPHHISVGGPCDARRSIGSLVQARVEKRVDTMALDPAIQARFNALKAPVETAMTDVVPASTPVVDFPPPIPTPDVPVKAARGRPRNPAPAPAPVPAPAPPPAPPSASHPILALSAELAAVLAQRDAILARMREALA